MNKTLRTLALTGAIALSLGSAGIVAAAEQGAGSTMNEKITDARRESQILTSFGMSRHLRGFDLGARVEGSKVTLDGSVDNEVAKELAGQIANDVQGIRHVDNDIVVEPGYVSHRAANSDRSFGQKVDDATITASIKSKLLWNSHTDGLDIHVATDNGKVILTGNSAADAEKILAGRIAMDTQGVRGVSNQIVLNGNPSHSGGRTRPNNDKAMSDGWITSKVMSTLMFTRGVSSADITVTTLNGVVTLGGVVDSTAERELAMRVTQDVRGVLKVDAVGLKVG